MGVVPKGKGGKEGKGGKGGKEKFKNASSAKGSMTKRTKKFLTTKLSSEIEKRKIRKKGAKVEKEKEEKQLRKQLADEKKEEEIRKKDKEFKGDDEDEVEDSKVKTYFEEEDSDEEDGDLDEEGEESDGEDSELDDIEQHKKELEILRKSDPNFAKYLEDEDKKLMDFGKDEITKEIDNITIDDRPVITSELFSKWKKEAVEDNNVQSFKKILAAFKIACYSNENEKEVNTVNNDNEGSDEETSSRRKKKNSLSKKKVFKYRIVSSSLLSSIVTFTINKAHELFLSFLDISGASITNKKDKKKNKEKEKESNNKNLNVQNFKKSPNWSILGSSINVFLECIVVLLSQGGEKEFQDTILNQSMKYHVFFPLFPKTARKFIRVLIKLWQAANESTRIFSFLNIKGVLEKVPSLLEQYLKKLYLTYVRNSRFINPRTIDLNNFMANCVIELYGMNHNLSYQYAFVYIRQLAIHLRNSMNEKTKESYANVYNWQFINSLKLWCDLVATYPTGELQHLVYPLVQIDLSVIKLIPTARWIPLRLICIRMLLNLARATNYFINTTPYLLEILNFSEFKKKKLKATKPLNFTSLLKVTKTNMSTKAFQDESLSILCELLLSNFEIYSKSITFPELILPTVITLKKFNKESIIPSLKKKAHQIVEQLNKNSQFINEQRQKVEFSPTNSDKVALFLKDKTSKTPLEQYYESYMKQEEKSRLERYNFDDKDEDEDEDNDDDDDDDDDGDENGDEEDDVDDDEGDDDEEMMDGGDDDDDMMEDYDEDDEEEMDFDNKGTKNKNNKINKNKPQKQQPTQVSISQKKHNKVKGNQQSKSNGIKINKSNKDVLEDLVLSD